MQNNREADAMSTNDSNVSPYLRRPIRTYDEFLRERIERATKANTVGTSIKKPTCEFPRNGTNHVEHQS